MQDKDFGMRLKRAECPVKVAEIVEKTIKAVYPHYYPSGAVQFFLDLHNERRIREALAREDIYFAVVQGKLWEPGASGGMKSAGCLSYRNTRQRVMETG